MRALAFAALLLAGSAVSMAADAPYWPADAKVYIISPHNGAKVKSPVTVVFGLKGLGVAPAGMKMEGTGHHHLLIDTPVPTDLSAPLPKNANVLHFGKGQTEVTLGADALPPGQHTLQLIVGDENHVPHDPPLVSRKITITVE
jgi:hypothetical protein